MSWGVIYQLIRPGDYYQEESFEGITSDAIFATVAGFFEEDNGEDYFKTLIDDIGKHGVIFDADKKTIVFRKGFKRSYFLPRFEKLQGLLKHFTFEKFINEEIQDGDMFGFLNVHDIMETIERTTENYIYLDYAMTFDEFLRNDMMEDKEYTVAKMIYYHT